MHKLLMGGLCVGVLAWAASACAEEAGDPHESGSSLYGTYCASCHGPSGKGDGPIADSLRFRPPDLTLFAQRNKGPFSREDAFRIIDGRKPVKGHGGADMPVWGDAFKTSRTGFSEDAVKLKLDALVDYLESIQVKKEAK
jgi:mono/diheme cytochrome c family protein